MKEHTEFSCRDVHECSGLERDWGDGVEYTYSTHLGGWLPLEEVQPRKGDVDFSILDFFFKNIVLIMLLQLSHLPPFIFLCPAHPLPPTLPPHGLYI